MMDGAFQEATLARISFWFLRHGETDWNAQGISQGNVDIPLNATGLAQARSAAAKLRNRGIASIVASPLSRARVTAEITGEALGLPVAIDSNLREVAFGVQEGQAMSGWFADWVVGRFTPEGAETFAALRRTRGDRGQSRDGAAAGGVGGCARCAVPFLASGDGHRAEHAHSERRADLLRTAIGRRNRVGTPAGDLKPGLGAIPGILRSARAVHRDAPRQNRERSGSELHGEGPDA
jgi:hypothetical protein